MRTRDVESRGTRAYLACGAVGAVIILALAGCVAGTPVEPTRAPTGTAVAPALGPTSSPTPEVPPAFVPNGTAQQNRPFFDAKNVAYFVAAGNVIPDGRGVIDNLVSAGFSKQDMQITPDRTAIGLAVDSLVFSVQFGETCLIGQYSALGYSTIEAPALSNGGCLVGVTRPIDW